jgi:hypothetical protein
VAAWTACAVAGCLPVLFRRCSGCEAGNWVWCG